MTYHKQVTTCRKTGGLTSEGCSCEHCCLAVCAVCGAYEGSLTTDCPGAVVDFDRQQEVYQTDLDYTEARGWHQGDPTKRRDPHFDETTRAMTADAVARRIKRGETVMMRPVIAKNPHAPIPDAEFTRVVGCSCGWLTPLGTLDSDTAYARHVAAMRVIEPPDDPHDDLKAVLVRKAVAWVDADLLVEDSSARLGRVEDLVGAYVEAHPGQQPGEELRRRLERAQVDFHMLDQRAQECDDEFRQAARKLAAALTAQLKDPTS